MMFDAFGLATSYIAASRTCTFYYVINRSVGCQDGSPIIQTNLRCFNCAQMVPVPTATNSNKQLVSASQIKIVLSEIIKMAQCKLLLEFQGLPIKPGQLGSFDHLDSINKPLVESTRFIWVFNNFNGGMSLRIMRALKAPNTPEMNRYQGFWPAFILRGKGFVKHCLVDGRKSFYHPSTHQG